MNLDFKILKNLKITIIRVSKSPFKIKLQQKNLYIKFKNNNLIKIKSKNNYKKLK